MSNVVVEPIDQYDILLNEDDEVLIAIHARMDGAKMPCILYDGKDRVLLYRTPNQPIFLVDVPEEVRSNLKQVGKVLMVEVQDDAVVREYMAPMKVVSRLPQIKAS